MSNRFKIDQIKIHDENNIKGFFDEYRWLSNMHDCAILFMGLGFNSTEAAYQACKNTNIVIAKQFQNMTGLQAKNYSNNITVRKDWPKIKYNIMAQLIFQKFLLHLPLREMLLDTGDKYIEETNYWKDTYWGVCDGVGENNLGKIIMATREYFKKQKEYEF